MCHVGCRYEYRSGYSCGECRLGDENPPRDAMCSVDDLSIANDSLNAENERLRNTLVQYGLFESIIGDPAEEFAKLRRDLHRAKRENAKLRELVQDYDRMLSSMLALCDCDFVPFNDAVLLALRSRMYKLGIEPEQ